MTSTHEPAPKSPRPTTDTVPDASEVAPQSIAPDTIRDGVAVASPRNAVTKVAGKLEIPPPPAALVAAMNQATHKSSVSPTIPEAMPAPIVIPALIQTPGKTVLMQATRVAPQKPQLPKTQIMDPAPTKPTPAPFAVAAVAAVAPSFETTDETNVAAFSSMANEDSIVPVTLPPPTDPRVRSTMNSVLFLEPTEDPDPVLTAKQAPAIAERRARFQRFVKGAIGACAGMCVLALASSLISGATSSHVSAKAEPVHVVHAGKTSVETLDVTSHGKAPRSASAPFVTKAARARSSAHR